MPPPLSVSGLSPAEFLATRWTAGKQLDEHATANGMFSPFPPRSSVGQFSSLPGYKPKLGPWSLAEIDVVDKAVIQCAKEAGVSVFELFTRRRDHKCAHLWPLFARLVPLRLMRHVSEQLRERYDPLRKVRLAPGAPLRNWTPDDDAALKIAVELNIDEVSGKVRWTQVGEAVGRTRIASRTRWEVLSNAPGGKWTREDDNRLKVAYELHGPAWARSPPTSGRGRRVSAWPTGEIPSSTEVPNLPNALHQGQPEAVIMYLQIPVCGATPRVRLYLFRLSTHLLMIIPGSISSQDVSESSSVDWDQVHISPVVNSLGKPQRPFASSAPHVGVARESGASSGGYRISR